MVCATKVREQGQRRCVLALLSDSPLAPTDRNRAGL